MDASQACRPCCNVYTPPILQGTEAHDQMLGKVFGYAAIIRSGQHIDQETATRCAEGLVHIANKKSFLRELAANVLLELTGNASALLRLLRLNA